MKIVKNTNCFYCAADSFERQPILYKTVYMNNNPFFTSGLFIHLEEEGPQLSSYILNSECYDVVDDRVPIKFCPMCGRKLTIK